VLSDQKRRAVDHIIVVEIVCCKEEQREEQPIWLLRIEYEVYSKKRLI
jgi:hypothetical protein